MRFKKILAAITAVFTAAAMTGCRNTADEHIMEEVLRDIPNVTEPAEIRDDAAVSVEILTETEENAEDTAAKTESQPKASQQDELAGAWIGDAGIIIFNDNIFTFFYRYVHIDLKYMVSDDKLILTSENEEDIYEEYGFTISDETLYLDSVAFHRYEHEDISISDFDEYTMLLYAKRPSQGWEYFGSITIDDGTVTSDEFDFKISLNGDKIELYFEDETSEYSYYIFENNEYGTDNIYLINDDSFIIFEKDKND